MSAVNPLAISRNSWLKEIPESWEVVQFRHLFRIVKEFTDELAPQVLSLTQRGVIERDISSNEGQLSTDYSQSQAVRIGDFVLNPMDLLSGWTARSEYSGVTSNAYFVFRLNEHSRDLASEPRYLQYVLQMYYSQGILDPFGKGVGRPESGGGRWTLNRETLNSLPLPVPTFQEQVAIADFLDRELAQIDTLIEKQQRLIQLARARSTASIRRITFSDEDSRSVPEQWTHMKLKHLCEIQSGYPFSSDRFGSEGEVGVVRQSDLTTQKLNTFTDEIPPKQFMIQDGDVLVSMSGDFNAVLWKGGVAGLNQRCAYLRPGDVLSVGWLAFVLPFSSERVSAQNVSTTISNMSTGELGNAVISLPPINIQRDLTVRLEKISVESAELIQNCNRLILLLNERRQALISAAVTGKIDVRKVT